MPEATDLARLRREYASRQLRFASSDIYSCFNPASLFISQQRQRAILRLLRKHGFGELEHRRIFEMGCGNGSLLLEFAAYGGRLNHLHGIDLLHGRVREAYSRLNFPMLACADGQHIPFREQSFDLVLQFTAFSSILDEQVKRIIAAEMLRVLAPGGMILWYDFWLNPTNKQTRGIHPSEIRSLFPGCRYEFHKITLAPPLVRRIVKLSWVLALIMEKITLFNSHYLAAIHPAAQ